MGLPLLEHSSVLRMLNGNLGPPTHTVACMLFPPLLVKVARGHLSLVPRPHSQCCMHGWKNRAEADQAHEALCHSSFATLSFSLLQLRDEVFSELSPEPLGAASLAQCHSGVLKGSSEDTAP